MPIPYRPTPRVVVTALAGYLDVSWFPEVKKYIGGLLVADGRGQPAEFVHCWAAAPSGVLWPEREVRRVAVQAVAHAIFDGCIKAPNVLFAPSSFGDPRFCQEEVAPSLPFGLVGGKEGTDAVELSWCGSPPGTGTAALALVEELKRRNLLVEPFSRIRMALREVYPEIRGQVDEWQEPS